MNSVHEPGSRTMSKKFDSGKYRVKTDRKWAKCTECTAPSQPAPSHACACCRALPCPTRPARLPPSCALRARVLLPPERPTRLRPRAQRPAACAPCLRIAPSRAPSACLRAQHAQPRAQLPSPLSQYNFVLRYSLASCSLLQYNTLYCNSALQQPFQSIAIQSSLYLCNTNHCITTQKPIY